MRPNKAQIACLTIWLLAASCEPETGVCPRPLDFSPPPGEAGSSAVPAADPAIVGWADSVVQVTYGSQVDEEWQTPDRALGAATGTPDDIVALGRGGSIVLAFAPPIADGDGADFAVFENGVNDRFLELAYVEVSSDGETFVRFPGSYLGDRQVGAYAGHDTTLIAGLAGKFRAGYGTPFDLDSLACLDEVLDGRVDLMAIAQVRIVDIVGDGTASDADGNAIYDPYPTVGSAGFDLEAVAVLNRAE